MNELLFNGMDIPKEVSKLLKTVVGQVCNGMNESEKTAFNLGVGNTMAILRTLLEMDEEPTVHIPNLDGIEEMDIEELEEIFLK
jgi:hypothetical protein